MQQNNKKPSMVPLIITVSAILILYALQFPCRYLYTRYFVARYDKQLAELIAADLATDEITDFNKPIFFIGSKETVTNGACLDLSEKNYGIYSQYAVASAKNLNVVEASQSIVSYLNKLGYAYTAPTQADYDAYFDTEIQPNLPLLRCVPWYESMLETEHCIIIQLSKE